MSKTYDSTVADVLLKLAFPACSWNPPPYIVKNDGIYLADEFRVASSPETAFDWLPSYDQDGPDAPNPLVAPMLPVPFRAADLAAFMLDGAGAAILDALNIRIGDDLVPSHFQHPRMRMVREALQDALSLLKQTVELAGPPNYDEIYAAHRLLAQCDEANEQANEREGVFSPGITKEESRIRRERAVASVAEQTANADQVNAAAMENWKAWRKRMLDALLAAKMGDANDETEPNAPTKSGATPQTTLKTELSVVVAAGNTDNESCNDGHNEDDPAIIPEPRIGWKKSVVAVWGDLLLQYRRKPTIEELVLYLEKSDTLGYIIRSEISDELKWLTKGKAKPVSRRTIEDFIGTLPAHRT